MKVLDIDGLNYYDGKIKDTYATKTELNTKAPLASPALTGTPTAPTPTAGDNSTKIATTAFVNNYLPLSGGTMTGTLYFNTGGEARIQNNLSTNDGYVGIYGGSGYTNGAYMTLSGKDRATNGGQIIINANDGTNENRIEVKTDKTSFEKEINVNGGISFGSWITGSGDSNTKLVIVGNNRSGKDGYTGVFGGAGYDQGAAVYVYGMNHTNNSGEFRLRAYDGTNVHNLIGTPDGVLTWDGVIEKSTILAQTPDNATFIRVCGGNGFDNGAALSLWGKSHSSNAGEWRLRAKNGTNDVQLAGYPNGNLMWAGNNVLTDGTVGNIVSKSISSNVSLSATTAKTLTSVSLPAGTWVIMGHVRYESITASKLYAVELGNTANNFSYGTEGSVSVHSTITGNISINTCRIINLNSTTTYYLCGYASAACSATAAQIRAVRIV